MYTVGCWGEQGFNVRVNVIRYVAVAMVAAMALAMAIMPALAEAEYPPDEPTESVTTVEEPDDESTVADESNEVARTGGDILVPLAIGLTAIAAGTALVLARRRGGPDGPGTVG